MAGWAGNGTNGSDVVETSFPRLFGAGTTVHLGFVYDNGAGGVSALLTTTGVADGPPILVTLEAVPIPALGPWGFAVLAILLLITGAVFARRRGARTGVCPAWSAAEARLTCSSTTARRGR